MFPQGRETVFSALQLSQKRSSSPHVHCILWGACCFGLEIQGAPLVGMGVSPGRGAVGTRGTLWPGSVQEALAGFLPPAGRAPLVPVLDAIYLAALLGLPTGFPGAALGPGRRCDDQVRFCRGWWLLWLAEAQRSAPDLCGETEGRPGHEQESIC